MKFLTNNFTLGLRLAKEDNGKIYLHDRREPDEFVCFETLEAAHAEYDRRVIAYRRSSSSSVGF